MAEMERALRTAHHGMAVQLLTLELAGHIFDEPDNQLRHGTSCGCPCLDRTGAPPEPYTLALEYGQPGCLPQSAVLPAVLGGVAHVAWEPDRADVTFDGLELDLEHAVGGAMSATVRQEGDQLIVEATGDLEIGPFSTSHDTRIVYSPTTVSVDGGVAVDDGQQSSDLTWSELVLPTAEIGGDCPAPQAGTAMLTGHPNVQIDFANPGAGAVLLTRGTRVSEPILYCGYDTELL